MKTDLPVSRPIHKELLRLTLAQNAFHDAAHVMRLLSKPKEPADMPLFNITLAGCFVTYSRPFMSGHGVGPLDKYFRTFPVAEFGPSALLAETLHAEAMNFRHALQAHHDLGKASEFLKQVIEPLPIDQLTIEIEPTRRRALATSVIPSTERFVDFARLFSMQHIRVEKKLLKLLDSSFPGLTLGNYRLRPMNQDGDK